jgi:tRNA uridine 5-carboxymethylaminomethyl modification enzyme
MFTARAEYRLHLRQDNADIRLREKGYKIGLVEEKVYRFFVQQKEELERERKNLWEERLRPSIRINKKLEALGTSPIDRNVSLLELLKRPEIRYNDLLELATHRQGISKRIAEQLEIEIKYNGYIQRQLEHIKKFQRMELRRIPEDLEYNDISGLSAEVREKLEKFRPTSLGQASRIPGLTPAAITALMLYLEQRKRVEKKEYG